MLSCEKEKNPQGPISHEDIMDCFSSSEWSELEIRNELIGSWIWVYSESGSTNVGRDTRAENTILEFSNDSILKVVVNDNSINTTKWMVYPTQVGGGKFTMKLDSAISILPTGLIFICKENLEFSNSYIDGSDNYFIRVE